MIIGFLSGLFIGSVAGATVMTYSNNNAVL